MITGDSGLTAAAIAAQTGIDWESGSVTGEMLDRMTEEELLQTVSRYRSSRGSFPSTKCGLSRL